MGEIDDNSSFEKFRVNFVRKLSSDEEIDVSATFE